MAVALTLSKKFLAEALTAKYTPLYAGREEYKGYSYDKQIYPQARIQFPEYNKLYPTNDEFTKYFVRDLTRKDPELLEAISPRVVGAEEVTAVPSEQGMPQQAPVGEVPGTMGMPGLPAAPSVSFGRFGRGRDVPIPHAPEPAPKVETPQSKLVVANKSGYVPETPPSKIYIANKGGVVTREHIIPKAPTSKIPYTFKNAAKNLESSANIFTKRAGSRLMGGLSNMLGGAGRAGGGMLGGAIGGSGRALGRFGLKAVDFGGRFSSAVSTRGSLVKSSSKKAVFAGLGALFLFMFGAGILGGITGTNQQPTAVAGPISGGNISSCLFYRSDQNPKGANFKSQILLGYFQEASAKSGVPATVLAGIARIESPSIVNHTDSNLSSYGCPTSPTGAKGLMQIQPPGTTGSPAQGIESGAQYLGIPVAQLNYCDLRQSIFLGAGVVVSKRGGSWDANKTTDKSYIDSVAETYYGCLRYSSCSSGPYSYGDDLYKSISECKPTNPVLGEASCPIPEGKIGCASYGKPEPWGGFHGACAVDSSDNGGHCNQNYVNQVGICKPVTQNGNLIRTAKSIDVAANSRAGDPVYLPTIKGASLNWKYKGAVSAGGSFGWIRLFQSEPRPEGVYSIHFVHVNQSSPSLNIDQVMKSGEVGANLYPLTDWPHAHITVGLNVGDSTGDLKDYSPNWLFADRDLGMCTK